MNFGRIRERSKNLHKKYFIHCAMRITRTKSSCLSLRWPSVNFPLRNVRAFKRFCRSKIPGFIHSKISREFGEIFTVNFLSSLRNRAREPRELVQLDGKTERGKKESPSYLSFPPMLHTIVFSLTKSDLLPCTTH